MGLVCLVVPEVDGEHICLFILKMLQGVAAHILDGLGCCPLCIAAARPHDIVQLVDDAEQFLMGIVNAFYPDIESFLPCEHGTSRISLFLQADGKTRFSVSAPSHP